MRIYCRPLKNPYILLSHVLIQKCLILRINLNMKPAKRLRVTKFKLYIAHMFTEEPLLCQAVSSQKASCTVFVGAIHRRKRESGVCHSVFPERRLCGGIPRRPATDHRC